MTAEPRARAGKVRRKSARSFRPQSSTATRGAHFKLCSRSANTVEPQMMATITPSHRSGLPCHRTSGIRASGLTRIIPR